MNAARQLTAAWVGLALGLLIPVVPVGAQVAPAPGSVSTADLPRWAARGPDQPVLLGDWFEVEGDADLDQLDNGAAGTAAERVSVVAVGVAGLDEDWRVGQPLLVLEGEALSVRVPIQAVLGGESTFDVLTILAGGRPVAFLDPVTVDVVLDLPPGRLPVVAPAKRELDIPAPAADSLEWILWLALMLSLIGVFIARVGRPVVVQVRRIPPEIVAGRALAHLRARLPRSQAEVPPFVVSVSHVLRVYIEGAFHLRAPELTTEEFLGELARRHDAVAARREVLERFLSLCDLVKFAGHEPELPEVVSLIDVAERVVEETHVRRPETAGIDGDAQGDHDHGDDDHGDDDHGVDDRGDDDRGDMPAGGAPERQAVRGAT